MHNGTSLKQLSKSLLLGACALIFSGASIASAQTFTPSARLTPPPVPDNIKVPDDVELFLAGHAVGTQNYVCVPSGNGVAYALFTPEATLFTEEGHQVMTHFFSPNPEKGNAIQATWEHSRDSSRVWGIVAKQSTDANFVRQDSIAWLLVEVQGRAEGPTGGQKLTPATHVQRLNTIGGLAPTTGCSVASDLGRKAFVPYEADYFFYKAD